MSDIEKELEQLSLCTVGARFDGVIDRAIAELARLRGDLDNMCDQYFALEQENTRLRVIVQRVKDACGPIESPVDKGWFYCFLCGRGHMGDKSLINHDGDCLYDAACKALSSNGET
jgi:hypothetical protein